MPSFQTVEIMGNLGKDGETRYTPSGIPRTTFSVAISDRWKDKEEKVHEETEWFNVVAWRKEWLQGRLLKGDLVFVRGKLKTREYEKDGEKRRTVELVADTVYPLHGRKGEAAEAPEARTPSDDDVPF